MPLTLLQIMDLIGTVAFALSGAIVGIRQRMDIFGVNVLAVVTATGGGMMRDLLIGKVPPAMFRNPIYVLIAVITANVMFIHVKWQMRRPRKGVSKRLTTLYETGIFLSDTLGLAAFTVDGVTIGMHAGFRDNLFLLVFLGFITGVGGGTLRDVLADRMPDILRKHVYAMASIAGALAQVLLMAAGVPDKPGMLAGFLVTVLIRILAAHYRWNLPKIDTPPEAK